LKLSLMTRRFVRFGRAHLRWGSVSVRSSVSRENFSCDADYFFKFCLGIDFVLHFNLAFYFFNFGRFRLAL